MGKFSAYAAVFAKLMVNGRPFGIHPFLVPIRNPETYEPLPGCEMGDIGPKFGYNSKDNGYLLLRNVRIPKENMLRRYAELDDEGNL